MSNTETPLGAADENRLLVVDSRGQFYAVPQRIVEQCRVSEEMLEVVRQGLVRTQHEAEVTGYAYNFAAVNQFLSPSALQTRASVGWGGLPPVYNCYSAPTGDNSVFTICV
jgi:hypothetical protein